MNPIDRNKIWKMVGILALITVVAGGLLRVSQHNSYTLGDYAIGQSHTGLPDSGAISFYLSEPGTCRRQF